MDRRHSHTEPAISSLRGADCLNNQEHERERVYQERLKIFTYYCLYCSTPKEHTFDTRAVQNLKNCKNVHRECGNDFLKSLGGPSKSVSGFVGHHFSDGERGGCSRRWGVADVEDPPAHLPLSLSEDKVFYQSAVGVHCLGSNSCRSSGGESRGEGESWG